MLIFIFKEVFSFGDSEVQLFLSNGNIARARQLLHNACPSKYLDANDLPQVPCLLMTRSKYL